MCVCRRRRRSSSSSSAHRRRRAHHTTPLIIKLLQIPHIHTTKNRFTTVFMGEIKEKL